MRNVILYVRDHGRLSSFTRVEDAETGETIPYVDLASRCEAIVREGQVVRILNENVYELWHLDGSSEMVRVISTEEDRGIVVPERHPGLALIHHERVINDLRAEIETLRRDRRELIRAIEEIYRKALGVTKGEESITTSEEN